MAAAHGMLEPMSVLEEVNTMSQELIDENRRQMEEAIREAQRAEERAQQAQVEDEKEAIAEAEQAAGTSPPPGYDQS